MRLHPIKSSRALCIVLLILFSTASAYAQIWPKPAAAQNTEVPCPKPPCSTTGLVTVGYGAPFVAFTGRYLSSETVRDYQQYYRTARARAISVLPPGLSPTLPKGRMYMQIGEGLAAYDGDRLITRLQSNEAPDRKSVV